MTADKQHLEQDIDRILNEIRERKGQRVRSERRMLAWRLTVRFSYVMKRIFDIVFSAAALILIFPLCLVVAILIKATSRGPIFFVQTRVGRFGRHFAFYKFRSMYLDAEKRKAELMAQNQSADGVIFKMKKDPRVTPIGRFIRRTSIDELPQFLNVFFGDMSLVGPRPPVPSEVSQYTLEDRKRLMIKPGLTCLWQISGRSDIPFKQQVLLDKEYIRSQSLWKDLLILLRTVPAILSGRGAY